MEERFKRTALLLGEAAVEGLKRKHVAVFGIGGVGGHAAEALVRSGVGAIDIVDHDTVSESNINRQLIATAATVGRKKVEAMKVHLLSINPDCRVEARDIFYTTETKDSFDFSGYDYVVDAIDTVTGKLLIIEHAKAAGVPVISAMGAGNKLDPTRFEVADIHETSVCPLARVMRRECKARGIDHLKVVYSKEPPIGLPEVEKTPEGKAVPGSVAFVPSVMGLIIAGEVIKDLCR